MKIVKLLPLSLAVGMLLTACNKEEISGQGGDKPSDLVSAKVILVNGPSSYAPGSTSNGSDKEREISNLELYVFDEDGNRDNTDLKHEDGNIYNGYVEYTGDYIAGNGRYIVVTPGLKQILVAANLNLGDLGQMTLEEVKEQITNKSLHEISPLAIPSTGIPMSGLSSLVMAIEDNGEVEVKVQVSRLYAKLTTPDVTSVQVEIDDTEGLEELGLDPLKTIEFRFDGYAVINGLNDSYVLYDGAFTDWKKAAGMNYHETTYVQSGANKGDILSIYSGKKNDNFFLSHQTEDFVYVYENRPERELAGGGKVKSPNTVYAMIVKGALVQEGQEPKVRYWRLNVSKDQNHDIYRNSIFQTEIETIKTIGYNTPEEAEENGGNPIPEEGETAIIAKIEIVKWNIFTDKTQI